MSVSVLRFVWNVSSALRLPALLLKATIHQVATMLATSKNVLFPSQNYTPMAVVIDNHLPK